MEKEKLYLSVQGSSLVLDGCHNDKIVILGDRVVVEVNGTVVEFEKSSDGSSWDATVDVSNDFIHLERSEDDFSFDTYVLSGDAFRMKISLDDGTYYEIGFMNRHYGSSVEEKGGDAQ